MTAKKDLKRRVRERQEQTGESYVAARRAVLAEGGTTEPEPPPPPEPVAEKKSPPFAVDEMIDISHVGAELGFRCVTIVTKTLTDRVEAVRVMRRMRTILDGTTEDPGMERFRSVVLRGERALFESEPRASWFENARRFLQRARSGVGGLTESGDMLAFVVDDHMVLAHIGHWPRPMIKRPQAPPRLSLSAIGTVSEGLDSMSVLFVP